MNCQARWTVAQKRFPRTAAGEWKDHALLEATVRLHFRTRKQARRDNRAYMATDEGRAALSPAFRNRMSEYDAELVKKAAARDERARLDRAGLMERLAEGTALEGIIEGTIDIDSAGSHDAVGSGSKQPLRTDTDGTNGGTEWRCQLASLRQATRLAGECPDPQHIGRESLDVDEWEREAGAAMERRRHGVEAVGKP